VFDPFFHNLYLIGGMLVPACAARCASWSLDGTFFGANHGCAELGDGEGSGVGILWTDRQNNENFIIIVS
jgi:hypothetical protein